MSSPLREIMKERPIIFSGDDVRAILDGRKTMTRRVVQVPEWLKKMGPNLEEAFADKAFGVTPCLQVPCSSPEPTVQRLRNPWMWPEASHLWVRETWGLRPYAVEAIGRKITNPLSQFLWEGSDFSRPIATKEFIDNHILTWGVEWEWKAAYAGDISSVHWRPTIHMPRWASRLTLEVTGVRVERLQDISEEDARAEGFQPIIFDEFDIAEIMFNDPDCQAAEVLEILGPGQIPAKADFSLLWDRINGKRPKLPANKESKRYQRVKRWLGKHPDVSWASNPWVWVISFKVLCN